MKYFYFLWIAILFSVLSFAQTEGASKIYGYKQRVLPGIVRVDENGKEQRRQPQYNYFIYLASTTKVVPVEIWVNGEAYSVLVTSRSSTPVNYIHPNSGDTTPKILVPKTTRKVLQLGPSSSKIQKPTTKGKTLSSKNELVVIYKGNGKMYYKTISKLDELEPLSMQ